MGDWETMSLHQPPLTQDLLPLFLPHLLFLLSTPGRGQRPLRQPPALQVFYFVSTYFLSSIKGFAYEKKSCPELQANVVTKYLGP